MCQRESEREVIDQKEKEVEEMGKVFNPVRLCVRTRGRWDSKDCMIRPLVYIIRWDGALLYLSSCLFLYYYKTFKSRTAIRGSTLGQLICTKERTLWEPNPDQVLALFPCLPHPYLKPNPYQGRGRWEQSKTGQIATLRCMTQFNKFLSIILGYIEGF